MYSYIFEYLQGLCEFVQCFDLIKISTDQMSIIYRKYIFFILLHHPLLIQLYSRHDNRHYNKTKNTFIATVAGIKRGFLDFDICFFFVFYAIKGINLSSQMDLTTRIVLYLYYEGHVEFMFFGSKTIIYRMKGAVNLCSLSFIFY